MEEVNEKNIDEEIDNASNTPYDDAFRTMMGKSGNLRLAFVNEMFHLSEPINPDTRIDETVNEYFVEQGNGKQRKIITDNVLHINGRTYHIECQTLPDGTILVRMFEYDMAIGLKESTYEDYHLTIDVPASGVLFLKATKNIPEVMVVTINTVGGSVEYPVKTMKLSDYTLDDLIKKDLLFLFPFYIFNLESEIKTYDKEKSRTRVVNSITELLDYVNEMYSGRTLTFDKYLLLTDMIKKVADNLSEKYYNARKEIDEIMGGKILEFKGERIYNEGKEEGKIEGIKEGKIKELLGLAYDKAISVEAAAERAENKYNVSKSDFMEMLKNYKPDDNLMQG